MLSASSSTPPPVTRPPQNESRPPKRRVQGPFILDDSESEVEPESLDAVHRAKKRMLHATRELEAASEVTKRNTACIQSQQESPSSLAQGLAPLKPHPVLSVSSGSKSLFPGLIPGIILPTYYKSRTCSGQTITIKERRATAALTYESIIAARSKTKEGRAKRSYYGIDIHDLMSQTSTESQQKQQPACNESMYPAKDGAVMAGKKQQRSLLWTEKYRAHSFMDLCGDDGTNRLVLRWLKRWDPLVFSRPAKSNHSTYRRPGGKHNAEEEKPHRKILLLTGPPGLGKTTLAHVCARQAGYDVTEINASDDRSRDVVKDRIRTSLGTQSVKTVANARNGKGPQRPARPLCVIVDEVDGVTSGSGASGEGGFVKALVDLIHVDERNANKVAEGSRKRKKGDDFRQMRPLILICNDVYHPSLRPLRHSNLAEIIHVGRPSMDAVVGRLKAVFEKEGIPCEKDAVRKLCEVAWGTAGGVDARRGAESTVAGDLRGIMVVGEWVAGRFRSSCRATDKRVMTRQWVENKVLQDVANGAGGTRGLGRGSVRDIVGRLFQEGAGFPKQTVDMAKAKNEHEHEHPQVEHGIGELLKRQSGERLSEMVNTSGEISSIVTEVFAEYPNRDFNDDCYLTKPNQAYDWLHFHDACQSRLYASQEWELAPYLSQPVLACHHLFASPKRQPGLGFERRWGTGDDVDEDGGPPPVPFSGPRADYQAREAERQNRAQLQALHGQLSPWMMRAFRSADDLACGFLPYLVRMLSPHVKPVVVGGSQGSMASVRREDEKAKLKRASEILAETGIALQKGKIENEAFASRGPQYVYRMDPDIDALSAFATSSAPLPSAQAPIRFAIRQVLDQELQRTLAARDAAARQARFQAGSKPSLTQLTALLPPESQPPVKKASALPPTVRRDFFGRLILEPSHPLGDEAGTRADGTTGPKVWITFHEGLNNAVRKPISLSELLRGL